MKTKLFTLFLALVASGGILFASDTQVDGIWYNFDDQNNTAEVTYRGSSYYVYNEYSGYVTIPSSVTYNDKNYMVTSIGSSAFQDCTGLTSVTIPNSVTSIGKDAFNNCTSLISVIIPNSVTNIGESAFAYCFYLTSVTIPTSVTSIGKAAFRNCASLTSVTIPNSVTSIGEWAFYYCHSLTSVTIPNSVTSIGGSAFKSCTGLTSVTIPNSVTSIGSEAFYDCTGLSKVYITDIAAWCAIQFVDFSSNPLYYANYLYLNDAVITNLIIPDSVTSIGNYAFCNCTPLTSSITIPNSVTSIGEYAFRKCSINRINFVGSIEDWCNKTWSPGSVSSNYQLKFNGIVQKNITIPNSIISLKNEVFYGCNSLTSVTIPNSVTSIGSEAFYECIGLTSIEIPNSVTSIGNNAFNNCTSLIDIYTCSDVDRIKQLLNNDNRVKLRPLPYTVTPRATNGTITLSQVDCESVELSVTSDYGYHFTQWSDGNTDNPRVIVLTQDTTVTAEFAKNTYNVQLSCDENIGQVSGAGIYDCLDTIVLNASSAYGYHFTQWSDGNTENPRTIILTQDTTFSAEFAKNSYTITVNSDAIRGYIEGAGVHEYLDTVVLTAISNFGYHFTQWSDGNTDNPRTVELTQDTTFTAEFAINQYAINVSCDDKFGHIDGEEGVYESFTEHTYTAVPNYGYHFDGWEMSATDLSGNYIPYKIAKFHLPSSWTNPYAWVWKYGESGRWEQLNYENGWYVYDGVDDYGIIIVPNGTTWYNGQTSDIILDDYACYSINTNYVVTRLPNNDENITISLVGNITLTAKFAKNTYTVTDNSNHDFGHIEGIGTFEYLDEISLTPVSNYGYHFAQWSDGNIENPRTIILTQDTTFMAEFAIDESGTCGENNALTWTYDDQSKTLTITGNGALTSNYTFGLETPTQMQTLIIGDGVIAIGDSAFYGMSTINHLFIGANVAAIGNYAFAECRNFDDITCYATVVPTINATTFANVGNKQYIYLYVPEDRERAYKRDEYWGEFDIRIKATETTTTDTKSVTVDPSDNTAVFTWPTENSAASYSLQITKDGVVFCTLVFNGDGQLIGIAFAPSRNGAPHAPAATMSVAGMSFTVTGLNSASKYAYHLAVKDANDNEVQAYSGEFATTGYDGEVNPGGEPEINTEGFEDIQLESDKPIKIFYHGQILILRGDRTYTLTGQEVK